MGRSCRRLPWLLFMGALLVAVGTENAAGEPALTDVGVSKSAPAQVAVGEEIEYRIVVTNHGPLVADVVLFDPIPAGTTYVSHPFDRCVAALEHPQPNINCYFPAVAANDTRTVVIKVRATQAGTVSNTVQISACCTDLNAMNDRATATTTVVENEPPPAAVFGAARTDSASAVVAAFAFAGATRGFVTTSAGGSIITSSVRCMRAAAGRILLGGVIVRATNPAVVGHTSLLLLRDGAPGEPDAFRLVFSSTGLDGCPLEVLAIPVLPVVSGDFLVVRADSLPQGARDPE